MSINADLRGHFSVCEYPRHKWGYKCMQVSCVNSTQNAAETEEQPVTLLNIKQSIAAFPPVVSSFFLYSTDFTPSFGSR